MSYSDIVRTHNGVGWTSTVPNQITCEWLDFIREAQGQPLRVLDVGAGFGVATIPALKAGAIVVANDIENGHLEAIRKEASDLGYGDRLEAVVARFPDGLDFKELDAIHCSNVLHFLRGEEIVDGAIRMHSWLKSGGKVFIPSVITSKAANGYHFKTGQRDWPSGTENVLPCRLLWWQVGFGAPAPWAAFEHMAVVQ